MKVLYWYIVNNSFNPIDFLFTFINKPQNYRISTLCVLNKVGPQYNRRGSTLKHAILS